MTLTAVNLLVNHHPADIDESAPVDVIRWAHSRFGDGLLVTSSFGDATLVHVAAMAVPGIEVALIDTGYLFAETLWYARSLEALLDFRLTVLEPETSPADADRWQFDLDGCCRVRKVEPLERALRGRTAWVTGLQRSDGPSRADAPVVAHDVGRGIVKVNPLAAMTAADVDELHRAHDLPRHPLSDRGYPSIGCWPCTRPVADGDGLRAGRWSGTEKTECGLHL